MSKREVNALHDDLVIKALQKATPESGGFSEAQMKVAIIIAGPQCISDEELSASVDRLLKKKRIIRVSQLFAQEDRYTYA